MSARRTVHPLLLEPSYWRERMESIDQASIGVVWTPRGDLSRDGKEVREFRIRTEDGSRLWGLFARPTWQKGPWTAIVRSVGPADRPAVTASLVRGGTAELVFQEPAGRRLADRVVDVMQVCRIALAMRDIERVEVEVPEADNCRGGIGNDELVIAEQLLARRGALAGRAPLVATSPEARGRSAGGGTGPSDLRGGPSAG